MRDFKNMKRQRGRNRGGGSTGGGGRPQHNANRAFDSNGPDNIKIRGHAQHVFEKYQQLARDAFSSGDRVLAENYLQHADHYFRVLRTIQPQRPPSEILGRDVMASGLDIDFEEEFEAQAEEASGETTEGGEAQPSMEGREPGRYDEGRQDRYDNGRGEQGGWRDRQNGQNNDRQSGERQNNERQNNERQGGDRYDRDRQNRDRNFGDRQGYDRPAYDRQGGDRQNNERQNNERQNNDRPYGDRQNADRSNGERANFDRSGGERQDRFEGRRDNRRFEGRRDERDYNRDNRYEPRVEEPRRDTRNDAAVASPSQQAGGSQPDAVDFAPSTGTPGVDTVEHGSMLRAQDGAMSQAPAFLQQPSNAEGEEGRPRVRRRRAPRSFRSDEGDAAASPSEAPTGEPASGED